MYVNRALAVDLLAMARILAISHDEAITSPIFNIAYLMQEDFKKERTCLVN